MKDESAVIENVRGAFEVGTPPKGRIAPHLCGECDEVCRLLGGRSWVDACSDFPQYCHDTFPLLSTAAMQYYLPAYMTIALTAEDNLQGASVLYELSKGEMEPGAFSNQQREAISQWLEVYCDEYEKHDMEKALARWRVP